MGYVQLAMGKGAFFAATQLLSNFLHVLFVWLGLKLFGLVGAAAAFVLMNATMFVVIKLIAFKLIGFSWSRDVWCLCFVILSIVMTSAAVIYVYDGVYEYGIGLVLSGLTSIYCLVGLVERLGEQHSLSRLYARLPLMPLFARKIF
jgi:PST family polysaccharide transporter